MEIEEKFIEVVKLIKKAQYNAFKNVNTELINLYWEVGEYISSNVESAEWGMGVVNKLANYLKRTQPESKGFSAQNIWRMKQFYETYKDYPKLSTLLRELTWSSHLHILSKTKSIEEKEFYLRLAVKEKYSVRELERQINSGFYERYMLSEKKISNMSTVVTQIHPEISSVFKDT